MSPNYYLTDNILPCFSNKVNVFLQVSVGKPQYILVPYKSGFLFYINIMKTRYFQNYLDKEYLKNFLETILNYFLKYLSFCLPNIDIFLFYL